MPWPSSIPRRSGAGAQIVLVFKRMDSGKKKKNLKVLRHCCSSPRTVEALVNTYERVRVTEEWTEAVPEELVQRHPRFFRSLFSLGQSPRALQHLARCALRSHLEGRLLQALPELNLPPALLQFLLLRFEDVLY